MLVCLYVLANVASRLRWFLVATVAVLFAVYFASFVVLGTRGEPASARVDYDAASVALGDIRRVLRTSYTGWQDTLSESTDLSARDGSFVAWWTSTPNTAPQSGRVARRNVGVASCPTLNETSSGWTTSERARTQTNMSGRYGSLWTYLRDTS